MIDKVQKIREEVEKRYEYWKEKESNSHSIESDIRMSECQHLLLILDSLQEEPVSEDLEEASRNYVDNEEYGDDVYFSIKASFKAGAKWQKENLWKSADGNNLPEIDREIIALTQPYPNDERLRVVFAHRPNKYTKVWNSGLGEEQVVEIERHDKGGWNIPDVKFWLDVELPKEIEP